MEVSGVLLLQNMSLLSVWVSLLYYWVTATPLSPHEATISPHFKLAISKRVYSYFIFFCLADG